MLDLVGSIIVGAFIVVMMLNMNDAAVENTYAYSGELTLQENLTSAVELLEYDFRKIGYCADPLGLPQNAPHILFADTDRISFLTDVADADHPRGDGIIDTLTYWAGSVDELASTQNPRDRILYRRVNNGPPVGANIGITAFRLRYTDALGNLIAAPVAIPGQIQAIQIDVAVENVMAYDRKEKLNPADSAGDYETAMWREIRLAVRNVDNR